MPHYDGSVDTSSPAILESCKGDPEKVRDKIMSEAPKGANVRAIRWESGKDVARITVEGPAAMDFLKTLGARRVVEHLNAPERKRQRRSSKQGA
jgi:hypothetical protein